MSRLERIKKVISDASDSDSNKGKRFKQVFGTRWLSFEGWLEAVLANYSSLSSVLASNTSGKSQGLLKSVLMSQISALSRIFQKKDIDCSVVNDHIVGCIGTLKRLLDIPGSHSCHLKETLPLPLPPLKCNDFSGLHFSGLPGFSSVSFEQEFPLFKKFVMRSLASNSSNMADLCRIVILGHH